MLCCVFDSAFIISSITPLRPLHWLHSLPSLACITSCGVPQACGTISWCLARWSAQSPGCGTAAHAECSTPSQSTRSSIMRVTSYCLSLFFTFIRNSIRWVQANCFGIRLPCFICTRKKRSGDICRYDELICSFLFVFGDYCSLLKVVRLEWERKVMFISERTVRVRLWF